MKKIAIIMTIIILMLFGLSLIRYNQSQKHFSEDGQYSFYSKRSFFGRTLTTMPGDGDTGGGTIYLYDEIEKKVIHQFETSWVRASMEACDFNSYNGGLFYSKSVDDGPLFNLPRPLKKMPSRFDKKIKSEFNIELKTDFETAQKALYFYEMVYKDRFMYYIQIPNRKLTIGTTLMIEEKAADILNITLDSVLHYTVRGNVLGYWHAPNKDAIDFAEKLTKSDVENLFKEQVYKQIEKR